MRTPRRFSELWARQDKSRQVFLISYSILSVGLFIHSGCSSSTFYSLRHFFPSATSSFFLLSFVAFYFYTAHSSIPPRGSAFHLAAPFGDTRFMPSSGRLQSFCLRHLSVESGTMQPSRHIQTTGFQFLHYFSFILIAFNFKFIYFISLLQ